MAYIKKLNWIQVALAIAILMVELGFLLMHRSGLKLSTGNIIGVLFSIIGVALIGIRSRLSSKYREE